MGTKIDYTKRAAKTLELTLDETHELVKRLHGHYKKFGIDRDQIEKSFFILQQIYDRKEQIKLQTTAPLLGFKHKGIELYRGLIVKLHKQGLSTHEIHKKIGRKKDAPSQSTIKRYIKALKEWSANHG
ncbi:MAG: hypothetical protein FAF04_02360 [Epsilonproteobacteria bacterium]|nr:hypothetical protein [Campylobacterota bacterium]